MGSLNARIDRTLRLYRVATVSSATRIMAGRLANKFGCGTRSLKRVALRYTHNQVYMRAGSSSDYEVFWQTFVDEELKPLRAISDPVVIVDCGANIGYASTYLLEAFPTARVIAIEPEPENAEVCQLNLEPYRNRSTLLRAAVWERTTQLSLSRGNYGDGREWATQVRSPEPGELPSVQAIDLLTLMSEQAINTIDLLKIDIEGSELQLFAARHATVGFAGSETSLSNCMVQPAPGYSLMPSLASDISFCDQANFTSA